MDVLHIFIRAFLNFDIPIVTYPQTITANMYSSIETRNNRTFTYNRLSYITEH